MNRYLKKEPLRSRKRELFEDFKSADKTASPMNASNWPACCCTGSTRLKHGAGDHWQRSAAPSTRLGPASAAAGPVCLAWPWAAPPVRRTMDQQSSTRGIGTCCELPQVSVTLADAVAATTSKLPHVSRTSNCAQKLRSRWFSNRTKIFGHWRCQLSTRENGVRTYRPQTISATAISATAKNHIGHTENQYRPQPYRPKPYRPQNIRRVYLASSCRYFCFVYGPGRIVNLNVKPRIRPIARKKL